MRLPRSPVPAPSRRWVLETCTQTPVAAALCSGRTGDPLGDADDLISQVRAAVEKQLLSKGPLSSQVKRAAVSLRCLVTECPAAAQGLQADFWPAK